MPLPMPTEPPPTNPNTVAYPTLTKQATATIDDIPTTATSILFSDKIMLTITQDGRLAQWIHVPLSNPNPNFTDHYIPPSSSSSDPNGDSSLLPLPQLTPHTLLGSSNSSRETLGQLLATQIASTILARDPEERRTVVVGLGLRRGQVEREGFYDLVDLVGGCL